MAMSKTDRRQLVPIVRQDFKLLKRELALHEQKMREDLHLQHQTITKNLVETAREGARIILEPLQPLDAERDAMRARHTSATEKLTDTYNAKIAALREVQKTEAEELATRQENIRTEVNEALDEYVATQRDHGVRPRYGSRPTDGGDWEAMEQSQNLGNALRRVETLRAHALVELDRREHAIVKDLQVGMVESDDAKGILAQVPTLEDLMPTPTLNPAEQPALETRTPQR